MTPADRQPVNRQDERQATAIAWAAKLVAEGHHRNCTTRENEGCDCYYRNGEYAAAEMLLSLAAAVPDRDDWRDAIGGPVDAVPDPEEDA